MARVAVESYAGFKADERPVRLKLGGETLPVVEVEDRWYSPGETFFRVRVEGGDRYVLGHAEAQDIWSLEAYRSAVGLRQLKSTWCKAAEFPDD